MSSSAFTNTIDASSPVYYEVNVHVDAARAADYHAFLQHHILDVVAQPGFVSAQLFRVAPLPPPVAEDKQQHMSVRYAVKTRADLDAYLAGPAKVMREAAIAQFGTAFTVDRRLVQLDKDFPPAAATAPK